MFRNLFLVLVSGSHDRVVHADDLSTTTIVPVSTVSDAVSVVSSFGAVDLIELYGGLGLTAAAAVLAVAPGVPVGFPGADLPVTASAVLFEDPVSARWQFGPTTIATVPSVLDAPATAASLVKSGAQRVELCGGMGPVAATAVARAVNVPVTTVLFGFESLPAAAAYRARFEASL